MFIHLNLHDPQATLLQGLTLHPGPTQQQRRKLQVGILGHLDSHQC